MLGEEEEEGAATERLAEAVHSSVHCPIASGRRGSISPLIVFHPEQAMHHHHVPP